jgi:hypothetical protein
LEKYGRTRQATEDNIKWFMRFACWITMATDTHSECVVLIAFHGNNGYANAPHGCFKSSLPVLLIKMALRLQHAVLKEKILEKSAAVRLECVFPPLTTHNTKNKTESAHRVIVRDENELHKPIS